MTGPLLLAFGIWMLFTADLHWSNVVIGLIGSTAAARFCRYRFSAWQLFMLMLSALVRLPLAIWQSILIVFLPYRRERLTLEKMVDTDSPWKVFCQTFLITLTPRSVVIRQLNDGRLEVHHLDPGEVKE